MITPRSLANQKMYHARILAGSWRRELDAQQIPASVLTGAFEPACRQHLWLAYGWFLLEILHTGELPEKPPANTASLPEIAPGKALPGEIRELQQLERDGWLGDMLAPKANVQPAARRGGSLAHAVTESIGPDDIDRWIEQLTSLFDRMADSLDEY